MIAPAFLDDVENTIESLFDKGGLFNYYYWIDFLRYLPAITYYFLLNSIKEDCLD